MLRGELRLGVLDLQRLEERASAHLATRPQSCPLRSSPAAALQVLHQGIRRVDTFELDVLTLADTQEG
jgi:hypothetical protein